jgi:hypothetical protein
MSERMSCSASAQNSEAWNEPQRLSASSEERRSELQRLSANSEAKE